MNKSWNVLLAACSALAMVACAPLPEKPAKKPETFQQLAFPAPPDEARFVFERSLRRSIDVVPEDANADLRRILTGEGARAGEGLGKPYGVAVFRGRVFVSDPGQRLVDVFDVPGRRFYHIGTEGQGELKKPLGLDVDGAGNVYVADATAKEVVVFDKDGKFLRRMGGAKWFVRPVSVTLDPKGDRMYVVDIGGVRSKEHRVRVFNPVDGRHLFDFGTRGSGPGEFNFPYDLAVGKDGRLYVVDAGNFRVQVFDHDGKYLKSFGRAGKQPGNFARPKEIAADADGNIYVVDAAFANFQIFDPDGRLLLFIGEHDERGGPAKFMLPAGIYVDEDGRVYVADEWLRKVDVLRPARLQARQGFLVGPLKAAAKK